MRDAREASRDDRFEVNEVADRCSDVVAELHEALELIRNLGKEGDPVEMPQLAKSLLAEQD